MIAVNSKIQEIKKQVKEWKRQGYQIGFVPTMGYLHDGHMSLVKKAVEENDKVVVSIFVNPIQFGPSEDLESYPRDFERDSKLCEAAGADLIFNPEPEEMYRNDFSTYVDMDGITDRLCGKSRPGHFRGVCTVVNKLFHITTPDKAYFGQKDAQQLAVIRRMVRDLDMDVEIIGCPIVREADGLAMSSRNTYLNETERKAALVVSRAIQHGQKLIKAGERDARKVIGEMKNLLKQEPLARVDYIEIADAYSMAEIQNIQGEVLIAAAVFIGKTRLIDNVMLNIQE